MAYHLTHPLHKIEASSPSAVFKAELDVKNHIIKSVSGSVDVTTFNSGNSNRDSHAMEVIDAIDYPDASFSSTSITQTGDSIHLTGRMMFHGVTNDVYINGTTQWSGNSLTVNGNYSVSLTGYKIDRPSLLLIPVEDALTFDFTAEFDF